MYDARDRARRSGQPARRLPVWLIGALLSALLLVAVCAGSASAAQPAAAWWRLTARPVPTNLPPGGEGLINIAAADLGPAGVTGEKSQITIADTLPAGLRVSSTEPVKAHRMQADTVLERENFKCTVTDLQVVACTTALAIPPYESIELEIPVEVTEPAGTVTSLIDQASMQGGTTEGTGAPVPGASLQRKFKITDEPVHFGVEEGGFSLVAENADGSVDTQAGVASIPVDEYRRLQPDDSGSAVAG